jgi:hypothetical protein
VVRVLPPALVLVVDVPMIRPEASRVVACTLPPAPFWRSMVWTIRPDESRTTSRQAWAGDRVARVSENREKRIAFMWTSTGSK